MEFPWPFRHRAPNVKELYVPFDALTPDQQRVLETLRVARHFNGDPPSFWRELGKGEHGNSVQRTFFCNTEALQRRKVKDGRTVLELVDAIVDVAGDEKGQESAEQFNINVRWKRPTPPMKSIKELFDDEHYAVRFSTDHAGESGIQEKGGKGYTGLHLLINNDDETQGHVHVDFRPTNWFEAFMTKIHLKFLIPKGLRKGHFNPNNADLGAVGPEKEDGKPIDNLEWFAKFYDDPRVLEFRKPIQHTLPDQPEVRANTEKRQPEEEPSPVTAPPTGGTTGESSVTVPAP